ncbi:MAG: hypothetical protein ACE147_15445 [Candidatus Methylomirabilales bacterium]
MDTVVKLLALAVALLLVLWPIAMAEAIAWVRRRRAEAIRLQIALTDALDASVGPIIAPVVVPRLRRPWRIEMVVPATRFPVLGRVLATAHQTLDSIGAGQYDIVVSPADRHAHATTPHDWAARARALRGGRAAA